MSKTVQVQTCCGLTESFHFETHWTTYGAERMYITYFHFIILHWRVLKSLPDWRSFLPWIPSYFRTKYKKSTNALTLIQQSFEAYRKTQNLQETQVVLTQIGKTLAKHWDVSKPHPFEYSHRHGKLRPCVLRIAWRSFCRTTFVRIPHCDPCWGGRIRSDPPTILGIPRFSGWKNHPDLQNK